MLVIKNLHVEIEGKAILKGLNLEINKGEVHAIMGPNGAGKSTLAKVLAGHPDYEVTEGEILFEGKNLLEMEPEERACEGLFMSFQYPPEIPGVNTLDFMRAAYKEQAKVRGLPELDEDAFENYVNEKMAMMGMNEAFKARSVNEGFSGGERKRNEIFQMAVFDPKLAVLDETDSGLDIDALKAVSEGVNQLLKEENAVLMITHYQRLLNYIKPDFVHVVYEGRVIRSGDKDLALELEEKGYDWLLQNEEALV